MPLPHPRAGGQGVVGSNPAVPTALRKPSFRSSASTSGLARRSPHLGRLPARLELHLARRIPRPLGTNTSSPRLSSAAISRWSATSSTPRRRPTRSLPGGPGHVEGFRLDGRHPLDADRAERAQEPAAVLQTPKVCGGPESGDGIVRYHRCTVGMYGRCRIVIWIGATSTGRRRSATSRPPPDDHSPATTTTCRAPALSTRVALLRQ
jgi:hypothetical protein